MDDSGGQRRRRTEEHNWYSKGLIIEEFISFLYNLYNFISFHFYTIYTMARMACGLASPQFALSLGGPAGRESSLLRWGVRAVLQQGRCEQVLTSVDLTLVSSSDTSLSDFYTALDLSLV